jgi:putative nucleotidyltransferase with HDIG domain
MNEPTVFTDAVHYVYTIFDIAVKGCFAFFIWVMWGKLRPSHQLALEGMYDALNTKSSYFYNHSKRVAMICEEICRHMGISGKELKEISSAAHLHDIGKLFLDEEILHCDRVLTDDEWMLVKLHPVKGSKMAEKFGVPATTCSLILSHHENTDGTGYPLNLKADQIDIGAKIIRIADSIDAMAMPRPYRKAMSFDHICAELKSKAGTWYDETIVKTITNGLSQRIRLIILNNY